MAINTVEAGIIGASEVETSDQEKRFKSELWQVMSYDNLLNMHLDSRDPVKTDPARIPIDFKGTVLNNSIIEVAIATKNLIVNNREKWKFTKELEEYYIQGQSENLPFVWANFNFAIVGLPISEKEVLVFPRRKAIRKREDNPIWETTSRLYESSSELEHEAYEHYLRHPSERMDLNIDLRKWSGVNRSSIRAKFKELDLPWQLIVKDSKKLFGFHIDSKLREEVKSGRAIVFRAKDNKNIRLVVQFGDNSQTTTVILHNESFQRIQEKKYIFETGAGL